MEPTTLDDLINAASVQWNLWEYRSLCLCPKVLKEIGKTKEQAEMLSNYYEGQFDAFCKVRDTL